MATRTEDEIRQHEDWYNEYLTLNERKKEAIRKWRIKKEVQRGIDIHCSAYCINSSNAIGCVLNVILKCNSTLMMDVMLGGEGAGGRLG